MDDTGIPCGEAMERIPTYHLLPTVTQAMYTVAICGSTDLAGEWIAAKYGMDIDSSMQLADDAYELLYTMVPEEVRESNSTMYSYHVLRVCLLDAVDSDSTGLIVDIQKEINKLLGSVK